jgi:uncharacterized protein YoxC|tara:strand:+ start:1056 stop:1502 length:447 start_codon:yes stop_codon:yes gene_type:complete
MEVEFGGVKAKGGKIFAILIALSTLIGGLYGAFEIYQRYLSMEEKINNFVSPDLSKYDEEIAILKSEVDMILDEVSLVASTAKELKDDLKSDVRQLQLDKRHVEDMVNTVKNTTREELRLFEESIKKLEKELEEKIRNALLNPLSGIK